MISLKEIAESQNKCKSQGNSETLNENKLIMKKHFEVVSLSSFIGLVYPIIFIWIERQEMNHAIWLLVPLFGLLIIATLGAIILLGETFPFNIPLARIILYAWAFSVIVVAGFLIHNTGGLKNSIFLWMLEYALLVSLVVRQGRWRSVIWIFFFCIVIASGLIFIEPYQISTSLVEKYVLWSALSTIIVLLLAMFSVFVGEKLYSKIQKKGGL